MKGQANFKGSLTVHTFRTRRKLCVDFIHANSAGSGLLHNKNLAHLHLFACMTIFLPKVEKLAQIKTT